MLLEYLPIFIFLVFAVIFASIMLGIGFTFGSSNPDPEKNSPYECGFEAFEDSRMKFDIRYYLVAILFIIFDLEIAFLFPWAIVIHEVGLIGLFSMAIFLLIFINFCDISNYVFQESKECSQNREYRRLFRINCRTIKFKRRSKNS